VGFKLKTLVVIDTESLNNRTIIPPISTNQTIPYNFNSLQIQKKYNDHAINPKFCLGTGTTMQ
jgi:hypothetical protein